MMTNIVKKVARSESFFHGRLKQSYERGRQVIEQSLLGERQIFPLSGPSRIGKLEIAQAWMEDFPNQELDGRLCKPLIRVTAPVEPNQRSLTLSIIRGLDGRVLGKCSTSDMYDQALRQLNVAGVRTIIIDEIQHLSEYGSAQKVRAAGDFLKVLSDELNISLILMGLPSAGRLLELNEQLRGRCLTTEFIYPYAWISAEDRQHFAAGIELIAEAYRDQNWSIQVEDATTIKALYAASVGRFGILIDLFSHAETGNDRKLIDAKCLAKAYAHAVNEKYFSDNPFLSSTEISERELNAAYVKVLKQAYLPIPKF
ncbi:TniB family NTP-binding protein [Pseudomonas sp. MIL19]|uniref:TniB family NTP-binding protein n=1 Tax=Pseudomonas sp. MIL19 TaxID=2976979 RepID=UPI002364396E|nr:TniB family NTP-binding protein [Pseudomonas sp. MIL19]MDD2162612.1 TniB family NTP-binding protein [Pseudomonas sp. MIL19]